MDVRLNPNVSLQYRTKAASFPSSCRTEQRSVFNMLADLGQAQPHLCFSAGGAISSQIKKNI